VLIGIDPANFRHRHWRRIRKSAGLAGVVMKDLRDTLASQLLSAGVPLGYVSQQLGHSTVAVTATHYAKWCGEGEYRDPIRLAEGDLPADVLAKLAPPAAQKDRALPKAKVRGIARARGETVKILTPQKSPQSGV
jgi:hypothetical protein